MPYTAFKCGIAIFIIFFYKKYICAVKPAKNPTNKNIKNSSFIDGKLLMSCR